MKIGAYMGAISMSLKEVTINDKNIGLCKSRE